MPMWAAELADLGRDPNPGSEREFNIVLLRSRTEGSVKDGRVVQGWKGRSRMEGSFKDGRLAYG